MILRPQPGYVPKVPMTPFRDQVVNFLWNEADPLLLLCPVRAMRVYLDHRESLRCSKQLFVCFGIQHMGKDVSKQKIAY